MKNRIKELRKEHPIISLENGKYNASLILAHDIAVYFGKTIEEIFLFEED